MVLLQAVSLIAKRWRAWVNANLPPKPPRPVAVASVEKPRQCPKRKVVSFRTTEQQFRAIESLFRDAHNSATYRSLGDFVRTHVEQVLLGTPCSIQFQPAKSKV